MRNSEVKLVGQQEKQNQLARIFETAESGKGSLVLLAGEAGVGKTRLAEELIAQNKFTLALARAREEVTPAYAPLVTVLRDCIRQCPDAELAIGPFKKHLAGLLPEFGKAPESIDRVNLIEAISAVFSSVAQQNPIIIFFEDLHWADSATIDLLPALTEKIERVRLLILATYRNDEIPRGHRIRWLRNELRRARKLQEITIESLSQQECAELLEINLNTSVSTELVEAVFEHTHGLPLFVEELAAALSGTNLLEEGKNGLQLKPNRTIPVPESVRDAVLLRLDTLSQNARNLLQAAAVAGQEFSLKLVTSLSNEESAIDELLEHNVITELESKPGHAVFRHALIREAVRSAIPWSKRRNLNKEIASNLEKDHAPSAVVAEFWLAANETAKARTALIQSAKQSCELHAHRDAAHAGARALEIWPEGEDEAGRLEALEQLAYCAQMSGRFSDAIRCLNELLDSDALSKNSSRLGDARRALATIYGLQGSWEQSISIRKDAATAFEKAELHSEAAVEWLAAGTRSCGMTKYANSLDMLRRAVEQAETAIRWDIKARAQALKGNIFAIQGKIKEGQNIVEEALTLALKHNLSDAAAEVYRRLASTLEYASDYKASHEAYQTAYSYCQTQGNSQQAQLCLGCMSWILLRTGDWKRVIELCKEALDDSETPETSLVSILGILGLVRANRGETRSARNNLQESLELAYRHENGPMQLLVHWGLAIVATDEQQNEEAEEHYLAIIDLQKKINDVHDSLPGLFAGVSFFTKRNMKQETSICTQALAHIATISATPEALACLAFGLGESAFLNNDYHEAFGQFKQAALQLGKIDLPMERAWAEFRAGDALAKCGNTREAIKYLRSAYRTTRKLGARPLAGQITSKLDELGETAEARRSESIDPVKNAGLTERQLEILQLLSDGLTNKEIAGKLYLSPRTIEMHVGHILERLDCRTRTEAVTKASKLNLL